MNMYTYMMDILYKHFYTFRFFMKVFRFHGYKLNYLSVGLNIALNVMKRDEKKHQISAAAPLKPIQVRGPSSSFLDLTLYGVNSYTDT